MRFLGALAALAMTGCIAVGTRTVVVQQVNVATVSPIPPPVATLPPSTPTGSLSGADICTGAPPDKISVTVGGQVVSITPLEADPIFGVGCQYIIQGNGPDDKSKYVNLFFAPEASFEHIRGISGSVTPIEDVGDDAYTAARPDGSQLWALVKGRGAAGVAIGGLWSVNRARLLASYVIALIGK
jgi:hypothetical protein